ncbi:MAG: 30S ribosomal protein S6 [Candidatus Cloacimonetes bacterium]|nr:30S ribosomal protein S6 [Candidatus Cloacimonadota bacterium]MBS3767295.1 30S ribosomal protein S6 [Candidatus Cloacimonadota bacterium]
MKKKYETMIVIPPLADDEIAETLDEVQKNIEKLNGEIEDINEWGKRKLAYEVNDYNYGYYVVILFYMEGKNISDLKYFYKQNEKIIRNIVIKREQEV